jgi:hypothetical protein
MIDRCKRDICQDHAENFYGYILEAKTLGAYNRIFIPSSFYKMLVYFFYDPSAEMPKVQEQHKMRYIYSIIYNILENNSKQIYLLQKLFPMYSDIVKKYTIIIDNQIAKICSKMQFELERTKDDPDLDPSDFSTNKIIHDYVYQGSNAGLILSIAITQK